MGTCTVCDSTASKNDEFLVHRGFVSRLSSQASQKRKGSIPDNQLANLEEEQKYALQPSNSRLFVDGVRSSSLRDSPRTNLQPDEAALNLHYRKDFPNFILTDIIGCMTTDYTNDYDSETVIYTGELTWLNFRLLILRFR